MIPFNEKLRTQQEVAALTQPPRPNMFAPGNTQGATVDQTVQGKQAANSQAAGYGANPQVQPQTQPAAQQNTQSTPQSTPQNNQSTQSQTPAYTGGSNNPNAGADYLASLLTTPQREEELRKQSVQRQRIMAVGDALRHIGNIYFATQGAPSQKFNNPAEEERKRYLQEKAIRDKNNYQYMTYQQAKAAQEAKMRQMEMQNQLRADLNAAQVQNYKERAEEYARHNKAIEDLNKSKAETAAQNAQRAYEHKVETDKARINIAQQRVNKSGGGRSGSKGSTTGGFTETTRTWKDESGVQHKEHVKTPTGTYDQQKKPNPMGGNNGKKKNPMS